MKSFRRLISVALGLAVVTLSLLAWQSMASPVQAQLPTVLTTSGPCDVNGDGQVDANDNNAFPANFVDQGNVCQELNAIGGFAVTLVTPAQFAAMTAAQLAAFDCIVLDTKPFNSTGLGNTWNSVVGVQSGGPVFLSNHDALWHSWFNRALAPIVGLPGDRFGAQTLIRDAATWACTDTGLVIFNIGFQFVAGAGYAAVDSLPAAWGISDGTVQTLFQSVGTDILPAFTSHPIYANVTDAQDPACAGGFPAPTTNPNSIASFPSFGYYFCQPINSDESYHHLFRSFDPTIFQMTEVAFSKADDPGEPPDVFIADNAAIDGHAISIKREKAVPTPGKVTGGGQIEDPLFSPTGDLLSLPAIMLSPGGSAEANFGFVVNDGTTPKGNLLYDDHGAGVRIKATSFNFLSISSPGSTCPLTPGSKHARFTGTAKVNGTPESLEVEVDDCAEPGSSPGAGPDHFSIDTDSYSNSGPLIRGNIQIHK